MGLSIAGAASVFFVGAILMGSILYGAVDHYLDTYLDADNERTGIHQDGSAASMEITSCIYNHTSGKLIIGIMNTGTVEERTSRFNVVINGIVYPSSDLEVEVVESPGSPILPPSYHAYITVEASPEYSNRTSGSVIGTYDSGLSSPSDIAVGDDSYVYVLDSGSVKAFSRGGAYLFSVDTHISSPANITYSDGRLYVLDESILIFDTNGTYVGNITTNMTGASPDNIWSSGGRIYLANGTDGVVVMDSDGTYEFTIKENITDAVDVFSADSVYVLDSEKEVDVFNRSGSYEYTMNISGIGSFISICGDGSRLSDRYLYLTSSSGDVVIINSTGHYVRTISEGMGSNVWGIDSAESIFAIDHENGIVEISRGCRVWVVGEYGDSDWKEV